MLRGLVNYLRGSVRLEVSGAFPERFLNLCAQRGIPFWDVEWLDANNLRLTVTRHGARQGDSLGQRVLCTVTPARRAGMPYFLSRFRSRYALLLGLALSLAAVGVLSRFVLTVEVTGNERIPTAEILTELRRQGLRIGAYGPGLDESAIGHETLIQLPELSWLSINLYGTRAQVLVREAVPRPQLEVGGDPGDVVAEAPGIITHMEVLDGDPAVAEGQTVVEGDVLISGHVRLPGPPYGDAGDVGWDTTAAAGRVYARTWRTLTAEIPLVAEVKAYTGETKHRLFFTFLGRRINFYGNSGISLAGYDKITNTWTAQLPGGRVLPLTLGHEALRAYTTEETALDPAAAETLLRDRLADALQIALGEGEVVHVGYTTAQRDGVLRVTLQAECREEIGRFVAHADTGSDTE